LFEEHTDLHEKGLYIFTALFFNQEDIMQIHKEDFVWDWLKHETIIFSNRMSAFLVAQSMLIIAFISKNEIIFTYIGAIISLIWIVVNHRHIWGTMRSISEKVNRYFGTYERVVGERKKIGFPNTLLLGYVLPLIVLGMWFYLYLYH
jgi:hypothetical protein